MAVKLYNQSGLPDEPMRSLLLDAQRLAGAKGSVVVKVTRGGRTTTCYAKSCRWVSKWFLAGRSNHRKDGKLLQGSILTDGGYVHMQPRHLGDSIEAARYFFETAIHEFAHIRDFQQGGRYAMAWSRADAGGRRPKWAKRPEEIRAVNRTDEALELLAKQPERRIRIDDAIIGLAIQIEEQRS